MNQLSYYLLVIITLASCSNKKIQEIDFPIYTYPNDSSLSNELGYLTNYLTWYYPESIKLDNEIVKTNIDTMLVMAFSNYMYIANEPILYNYYLNRDEIRFLLLNTRGNSFIFNVIRESDRYYMEIKETSEFLHFGNKLIIKDAQTKLNSGLLNQSDYDSLYITNDPIRIFGDNIFEIKEKIQLEEKDWNNLINLLDSTSFWNTLYKKMPEGGDDGSYWIIEAHLSNRYWFSGAWEPKGGIYEIGNYINKLSGLNGAKSQD